MNLTFHWPDYRKVSFALPGFILLSVLLHAVAFTVFQAVYPPSGTLMPPPASVTLLTPSTPEYRALLNWVDAGDPALASRPQEVVPHGLMELPYQPSYSEVNTMPLPGPLLANSGPGNISALMETQGLLRDVSCRKRPDHGAEMTPPKTHVSMSESLSARAPKQDWVVRVQPAGASRDFLDPAQYLVGVDASGKVAYQFLQHSSKEPSLDREAESLLADANFSPDSGMTWGMVSFYWGSDVYNNPSRGAASETPIPPK